MSDPFYRAFEERYRGERDIIAQRLTAYDSFTLPLAAACPGGIAIDLGCGRGEWLELTARQGFAAFGVDLDEGMLAACRERGLNVETADALATLRSRAANSVALISAFHLVEHLPFELVQELVAEALRVLVPGGLLIMETPNPENLLVGTNNFYLDPSHVKPVPALLLNFLTEYAGFGRQTVLRLHGTLASEANQKVGLLAVLQGVSFDYAVVAQKNADATLLGAFDSAFNAEHGVGLEAMAGRFDEGMMGALTVLNARAAQSDGLDLQAREQGRALAELDNGLRHVSGEFDKRLGALETIQFSERLDVLGGTMQSMAERWRADASLQMIALERRMDASLRLIESDSARRADEAEERHQHSTELVYQRLDVVERHLEQADRRLAPLTRRVTAIQLELHNAVTLAADSKRIADDATWRMSIMRDELQQQQVRADHAEARLHEMYQRVVAMTDSTSWRVTAPMRRVSSIGQRTLSAAREGRLISSIGRRVFGAGVPADPQGAPPGALRALKKRVRHSTLARRVALPLLRRFPFLERPLRRLSDAALPQPPALPAGPAPLTGPDGEIALPHEFSGMPESSRQVLLDLARASLPPSNHHP